MLYEGLGSGIPNKCRGAIFSKMRNAYNTGGTCSCKLRKRGLRANLALASYERLRAILASCVFGSP